MKNYNESFKDLKQKLPSLSDTAVSKVLNILRGNSNANTNTYLGGSISQYSKNLVMTFPVLCDNSLSPQTASLINKVNERNITTMLMLLFTAMNIEASDGMKVLSQVHKNITTSMDVYQVMDKMEQIGNDFEDYNESTKLETIKGEYSKESEIIKEMIDELKFGKVKRFPVDSLNEESLNRFKLTRVYKDIIIREDSFTEKEDYIKSIVSGLYDNFRSRDRVFGREANLNGWIDYINSEQFVKDVNQAIKGGNLKVKLTDTQMKELEEKIRDQSIKAFKNGDEFKNFKLQNAKLSQDIAQSRIAKLIDTDVKKANEIQPTVIQINYSQKKEDGNYELRSFLAGVKSRLVAVDSMDIIERIIAKNRTKINFLNFIRATTGEISFFHDFLFAIDQAKLDSKNGVKKGEAAKIWNCLSNRASSNNKNKLKKLGNDASAITMLVISQETVNYMKSVYKFDLEVMSNTKTICDAYNLMGIMIVDESIEVLKSFYVGNNNYEQTAFSFLEKENSNSDYKKIVNLIGRMNTR